MHILTIKRNPYPASLAATSKKTFAADTIMLSMLMSAQTLRAMPQHGDMADAPGKVGYRTIVRVDSVTVNAPAGTAPRLPYQVMVEYSDGSRELRQVRWRNSSEAAEREQADISINPVGSTYTVKGFILGDNTTPDGYPVYAEVTVVDGVYDTPSPEPSAQPLPLNKVKVTGDNRLTSNRELAIDHLLSLDVTQQLYNYRDTYGLPTIVTNCSNNYGPYQFPEKLIPLFINNIRHRKPLPVYGKGENVRDWLYVEDHARAIDLIFHEGKVAETYNIGGFNEWKNIDLIKVIIHTVDRLLGRGEGEDMDLITYVTDRKGHDMRYAIDSRRLQRELGWEPSLQFEEGIEKTVRWYLENQEWMDNVTSGDYQSYYDKMYKDR